MYEPGNRRWLILKRTLITREDMWKNVSSYFPVSEMIAQLDGWTDELSRRLLWVYVRIHRKTVLFFLWKSFTDLKRQINKTNPNDILNQEYTWDTERGWKSFFFFFLKRKEKNPKLSTLHHFLMIFSMLKAKEQIAGQSKQFWFTFSVVLWIMSY